MSRRPARPTRVNRAFTHPTRPTHPPEETARRMEALLQAARVGRSVYTVIPPHVFSAADMRCRLAIVAPQLRR